MPKTPRLKELRDRASLAQHELAEVSGVSRATIADAEAGNRTLQPKTLRKLAEALGASPEELVATPKKAEAPNANASPGLHDPGLVPENLEHAAEMMRAATDIAAALSAEWNQEVEEYAGAGRDLPSYRTVEMQCTAIRLSQMFSSAFEFIQSDAERRGYSPDPATWATQMQEDLIWNLATLQVLNELVRHIEKKSDSPANARAVRAEFGPVPNEALNQITAGRGYSEALVSAREMAGVA